MTLKKSQSNPRPIVSIGSGSMKEYQCPKCNSKKWKEVERGKWYCFHCGFDWWDPAYHKVVFTRDSRIGDDKLQFSTSNDDKFIKDKQQLLSMDFHDNVYLFSIKKDNKQVSIGQKKRMVNWDQEFLTRGETTYKRTTRSIIITIKRRFLEDLKATKEMEKKDFDIRELFVIQARKFQEEFNILLDVNNPVPLMKEIKSIDGFKSPVMFVGEKMKCVYPTGELEAKGIEAVQSWKNLIDNLAVETKADKIMDMMIKWNQNFELHYGVLNQTKDTLIKLEKHFEPKKENLFLQPLESLIDVATRLRNEINKLGGNVNAERKKAETNG